MVFMDTVSSTVATSPSAKVLSSSSSSSPVIWLSCPEEPPTADDVLSGVIFMSSSFSFVRTLPSAASTVRSMLLLSSVMSETLAELCSAAATFI